jgi:hypothetical protein
MADYKELIRRAIQALPENNGASRRAVYEKARAALVGQLRGLDPPLSAREITQHRLQLEDCIRQVEQEASEAVIAGLKQNEQLAGRLRPSTGVTPPRPAPIAHAPKTTAEVRARPVGRPANADSAPHHRPAGSAPAHAAPALKAPVAVPAAVASGGRAVARKPSPEPDEAAPRPAEDEPETIEAIIAAAENARANAPETDETAAAGPAANGEADDDNDDGDEAPPARDNVIALPEPGEPPPFANPPRPGNRNGAGAVEARPLPAIVARAEALKTRPSQPTRRLSSGGAVARPIGTAMSSVREVALESHPDGDPQIAIERAIATLEREAQNDGEAATGELNGDVIEARANDGTRRRPADMGAADGVLAADPAFARAAEPERGGGNAITIFLLVFLGLLVIAGGAGFWAWREGYIDFNSMFGRTAEVATKGPAAPATPAPKPAAPASTSAAETNTEPAPSAPAQSKAELSTAPSPKAPETAASPAPSATPPAPATMAPPTAAEPSTGVSSAPKSEERLTQSAETPAPAAAPEAAATAATPGAPPANPAGGSQSLLLEASQAGTTGAVPFSGTVSWEEGKDELGQPTIVGKADIPARNLAVSVLVRKNSDPTLPASNLMEINFTVGQSFIGGSIAGLPGVLMKNEELVPGTQLIGASARVVGNSFLFALSSSPADEATNRDLLTSRKWLDLAVIYATGKRAILTLEKDDKAQALFTKVFDEWAKESPSGPAAPNPAGDTSK